MQINLKKKKVINRTKKKKAFKHAYLIKIKHSSHSKHHIILRKIRKQQAKSQKWQKINFAQFLKILTREPIGTLVSQISTQVKTWKPILLGPSYVSHPFTLTVPFIILYFYTV
jgi:hypothetical protein